MKNKKNLVIAIVCIAVAVALLVGIIVWRAGGDQPDPTTPSNGTNQSTGQGSTGGEATKPSTENPTILETGLGASEFPEDSTGVPTDTWPSDITPPNNEPTETIPVTAPDWYPPDPTDPPETEPTEPATQPTEPATEPTEPATQPTEPATEPTEPATQPTEPATEPTEPATQPTEPATEPTEPATQPTEPEAEPTEPATQPTEPAPTEPEVYWEKVNETVYATSTVNIRKGPDASSEKLGQLKEGDSILRTHIGNNGWSRVEYNGQEAYISSDYLTRIDPNAETEPTEPSTQPTEDVIIYTYPDGTTGTVPMEGATYVDSRGVTRIYHYYPPTMTEQERADAENGIYYCNKCGRICGNDGSDGKCVSWLTGGEHTCPSCGATVMGGECHTCDED